MYEIYKHTNKINDKSYIGYTKRGVQNRLIEHSKNKSVIGSAIRKYTLKNFETEICAICETHVEACSIEKFYIVWYNSFNYGYNMTPGGDGGSYLWSEEQKKNHSLKMSGDKNGMYNKHHSAVSKNLIGSFWKRNNINHPNINRKVPQSQKDIQSIQMTGRKTNFIWISNNNVKKSIKIHKNDIYDYLVEGWYKGRDDGIRSQIWRLIHINGEEIIERKNIKNRCCMLGISWNQLKKNDDFIKYVHKNTLRVFPNTLGWKLMKV